MLLVCCIQVKITMIIYFEYFFTRHTLAMHIRNNQNKSTVTIVILNDVVRQYDSRGVCPMGKLPPQIFTMRTNRTGRLTSRVIVGKLVIIIYQKLMDNIVYFTKYILQRDIKFFLICPLTAVGKIKYLEMQRMALKK